MEVSYIRDLNYQYLVITDPAAAESDEVAMMVNNHIPGLLHAHLSEVNGECQICYEITAMRSLAEQFEGITLGRKDMTAILLHFARAVHEAGRYLLRGESFLLDPEMVYAADHLEEIRFCCYPAQQENAASQMNCLCRFFLDHINYDDRDSVRMAYELFQESLRENATVESFLKHITDMGGEEQTGREAETEEAKEQDLTAGQKKTQARPAGRVKNQSRRKRQRQGKTKLRYKKRGRLLSVLTTACIAAMVIYGGLRLCIKLGLLTF